MTIKSVYAQLCCTDLQASLAWCEKLLGRAPDEKPMPGLAEWHHGDSAGLQLFENAKDAGHGTLTLVVIDISDEHARLERAGLVPGEIESGTSTTIMRLYDPDGNLIVVAESNSA